MVTKNNINILICGDSFAVDYTQIDPTKSGWSSMLANEYAITNCAQAGVSEYKILKQLEQQNLDEYEVIIVSHTSPLRVYIKDNPMYLNNQLYSNADLIYSDVLSHYNSDTDNIMLQTAKNYFEIIFDQDYYQDMYFLLVDKIKKLTHQHKCLHLLTIFDQGVDVQPCLNLKQQFKFKQGTPNHYSNKDNIKICNLVKDWIASTHV